MLFRGRHCWLAECPDFPQMAQLDGSRVVELPFDEVAPSGYVLGKVRESYPDADVTLSYKERN